MYAASKCVPQGQELRFMTYQNRQDWAMLWGQLVPVLGPVSPVMAACIAERATDPGLRLAKLCRNSCS